MRLTRAELLRVARALPEDLDALERRKLIVPVYEWVLFSRSGPWYTEAHFQVLRQYALSRRALERNRRLTYTPAEGHAGARTTVCAEVGVVGGTLASRGLRKR